MRIHDLIREHLDPNASVTAQRVFDALGVPHRWRVLFEPLVAREAAAIYRDIVSVREDRFFHGSSRRVGDHPEIGVDSPPSRSDEPGVPGDAEAADIAGKCRDLFASLIYCGPTFGHVRWGEATVEALRHRAVWYRKMASGYTSKAADAEFAIDLIERAGVTCLQEIPDIAEADIPTLLRGGTD